jgi:hypothetical protein
MRILSSSPEVVVLKDSILGACGGAERANERSGVINFRYNSKSSVTYPVE